ncbi:hypothetical protein Tco_1146879 [Tanacetum coccineum]
MESASAKEEPYHDIRPTLQRIPFYCTPPTAADAIIPDPTLEGLTASNSSVMSDDDDDACFKILLVTPICSATVIPSLRNQDSQGKGIMTDVAVAPSTGVSRLRPSFSPASSFRDVFKYAIHMDFFPFSLGPYYATYPEGGVAGYYSRLKSCQDKLAGVTGLESQVSGLQRQVFDLAVKLSSSDAALLNRRQRKRRGRKRSSPLLKAAEPLFVILQLEPEKLALSVNVPASRDARVSPPLVKESTMTPTSESLEFPSNVIPASSTAALEPNEEWVNAMVDGPDHEMTDGDVNAKPGSAFMQGASYVVVALSTGEKGDGSLPSSTADEEAASTPSRI